MKLKVEWADNALVTFEADIERLQREFPKVLPRIVNQVGNRAKTQVIRNLTKQTGLPRKTIVEAVKVGAAGGKRLSYEMTTRGGNIRLKYLKPKETRPGVVARPRGERTLYPHAFMLGGSFPNRHGGNFDGHVMRRLDTAGTKLTQVRSGVFIPREMTTGATKAAFENTAAPLLQERVGAVLRKLFP